MHNIITLKLVDNIYKEHTMIINFKIDGVEMEFSFTLRWKSIKSGLKALISLLVFLSVLVIPQILIIISKH